MGAGGGSVSTISDVRRDVGAGGGVSVRLAMLGEMWGQGGRECQYD